ncbi:MAG: hypothetical protein ACP5F6_03310 [Microbacter sp.]
MTLYKSNIQHIGASPELVFQTLSDLRNLERSRHLIPENAIQDVEFEENRCLINLPTIGRIDLFIQEKIPSSSIRFNSESSPIDFHLMIHLQPLEGGKFTQLQVEVHADIPQMVKLMFNAKIQQFVNQFAEALASIHYSPLIS